MTNKHEKVNFETTIPLTNLLEEYDTSAKDIHYTLHNLFRGLKTIRLKYKLTINEIIFLNGIYLYCKHESTCISQDACLRFIGYYNLNKVKYYLGALKEKKMIYVAEVIKGYNRYKLTQAGTSAINDINGSFERCLYEWFNKYCICL